MVWSVMNADHPYDDVTAYYLALPAKSTEKWTLSYLFLSYYTF